MLRREHRHQELPAADGGAHQPVAGGVPGRNPQQTVQHDRREHHAGCQVDYIFIQLLETLYPLQVLKSMQ